MQPQRFINKDFLLKLLDKSANGVKNPWLMTPLKMFTSHGLLRASFVIMEKIIRKAQFSNKCLDLMEKLSCLRILTLSQLSAAL